MQSCEAIFSSRVNIRTRIKQQIDGLNITTKSCDVQWCITNSASSLRPNLRRIFESRSHAC